MADTTAALLMGRRSALTTNFSTGATKGTTPVTASRSVSTAAAAPDMTSDAAASFPSSSDHHQSTQQQQEQEEPISPVSESSTKRFHPASFSSSASSRPQAVVRSLRRQYFRHRFSFNNHRAFHERWRHILQTLSIFGHVSEGNVVTPYRETEDAYRAMWGAVDDAKKYAWWQTYICKDDEVGKETMKKLEAAHARGVATELLYDCGGNITGRTRLTQTLRALGVNVIRHRPFFQHMWKYFASGGRWEHSPALRNHRKILLVDDTIAFTGGLNIGNDYCGKAMGGNGRFRDTHCRVVGPAVKDLRVAYEDTKTPRPWRFSLTRWRKIISEAVQRRRSMTSAVLREHVDDALRVVKQVNHGATAPSSTSTGGPSSAQQQEWDGIGSEKKSSSSAVVRLRWLRQRLRQARQAVQPTGPKPPTTPSSETTTTAAQQDRSMKSHWRTVRRYAAAAVAVQQEQHALRQATKRLLEVPIADTDPVPEAVTIHPEVVGAAVSPTAIPSSPLSPTAKGTFKIAPMTQILSSNPHTRDWSLQVALWHVTKNAHRRVWITTPYYMPHRKLMQAILIAAQRGVDVRIMAGSQTTTDPWFMWYASRYLTERFLRAGVTVYEYEGNQIMHAKTVVVDSVWSSIGSYNWDCMSNKNMEVCLTHFDFSTAREMEAQFLKDVSLSRKVTLEMLASSDQWPLWKRLFSRFAYHAVLLAEKLTFLTYRDRDLSSSDF